MGNTPAQGQPLLTFIDIRDYWVSAEFRENSLGNVKPGDQAEIIFDVLPGRIYRGTVENIGWAVARGPRPAPAVMGALPTVKNQTGWVRDPQRFPVRIDVSPGRPRRVPATMPRRMSSSMPAATRSPTGSDGSGSGW